MPTIGVSGGNGDRIILWPGSASGYPYSIGINSSTLWYSAPAAASHQFYNNEVNTKTIDSTGNVSNGPSNYKHADGLRIGGFDVSTLYNGNNNIGLTVNNGYSINFYSFGGYYGTIMKIKNSDILAYQTLSAPTLIVSGSVDLGTGYQTGTNFRCRMTSYFELSIIIMGMCNIPCLV